jgi:hypothetical protein
MLWNHWWHLVCALRSACARTRTFLWMALCLAGMTVRKHLLGVTSIVRALGLEPACYDRLLDFFHSPALDLNKLTCAWCALVFRFDPLILRVNRRPVLVGDGIQVAKAGRQMPGVKKLHQESESHNKAEYIFGHSCQAVAVLTQAWSSVFALPLACRIHQGTVFSNRDQRTLLDKMILLLDSLGLKQPFYFVADAYYASGKVVRGLLMGVGERSPADISIANGMRACWTISSGHFRTLVCQVCQTTWVLPIAYGATKLTHN